MKYCINLELLNVDLPFAYTCLFWVSLNSQVRHSPPSFRAFHILLIIICTVAIKTSEIYTLFLSVRWQIFCILTIMRNKTFTEALLKRPNMMSRRCGPWTKNVNWTHIATTFRNRHMYSQLASWLDSRYYTLHYFEEIVGNTKNCN